MENASIANDVKTSLSSLEVVRVKSINSHNLSSDEIQTAQRNLSDIIRTAESIKKSLHSSGDSKSSCGDEGSCIDNEGVRTEQKALPTDTGTMPERRSTTAIGTNDSSEEPKRRLSTPFCIVQSSNVEMRVSFATVVY